MGLVRAHLVISGTVQGVFYRASAQEEGVRLGLRGWVRNLRTGEVEAEIEGDEAVVERFVAWCRRGPPDADVSQVEVTTSPHKGDLAGFSVLRTA